MKTILNKKTSSLKRNEKRKENFTFDDDQEGRGRPENRTREDDLNEKHNIICINEDHWEERRQFYQR